MNPNRGEMRAMGTPVNGLSRSSKPTPSTVSAQISVHEFHNSNGHPLIQNRNLQRRTSSHFESSPAAIDDFFEQMLSTIPSWPDLTKPHWDLTGDEGLIFARPYDDSSLLAARLRQQQISSGGSLVGKQTMLPISAQQQQQHQLLLSAVESGPAADSDSFFKSPNSIGAEFSAGQPQHFQRPEAARVTAPRQRVRARRGQATDPHSIAERLRRERIAERMKALQDLVPNANKTDKASMLDEIIDYVKFLQLQVKVLSISRLGGAAAASPLIADVPSEGRGSPAAASETVAATENLVAKLIEEDMGSAMQYLQGKGLCLMPISLASTISTASSPSAAGRVVGISAGGDAPPSSPSLSVAMGPCGDTIASRFSGEDAAKR